MVLKNADLREDPERIHRKGGGTQTGRLCGARKPARASDNNDSKFFSESLILAQNERWERGLGMQVERDPGSSNTPW